MGLAPAAAKLLLNESRRRSFAGRVLSLGRQHTYFTSEMLRRMAREFAVPLHDPGPEWPHVLEEPARSGFISDGFFLRCLGFTETYALDYSDLERPDFVFDLNQNELPSHLRERFDVILDGGTIEHVFHVPNVLRNIVGMLTMGGRIIHMSPSSNYLDHGFYMFSPTLFWDYYTANSFEVNYLKIVRHTVEANIDPWEIYNYVPGGLPCLSGGLDDAMYLVFFVATKTEHSTADVIPQQGFYVQLWSKARGDGVATPQAVTGNEQLAPAGGWRNALRKKAEENHAIFGPLRRFVRGLRRLTNVLAGRRPPPPPPSKKGAGLPVEARY